MADIIKFGHYGVACVILFALVVGIICEIKDVKLEKECKNEDICKEIDCLREHNATALIKTNAEIDCIKQRLDNHIQSGLK